MSIVAINFDAVTRIAILDTAHQSVTSTTKS